MTNEQEYEEVELIDSDQIDSLTHLLVESHGAAIAVPRLMRHYLPLGATFHAFHHEAGFGWEQRSYMGSIAGGKR
jgi:hypothetical protein